MADVLCLGGTGTVGRRVVEGLVARGATVRCVTRSEDRAGTAEGSVDYVFGDLETPETLAAACTTASQPCEDSSSFG